MALASTGALHIDFDSFPGALHLIAFIECKMLLRALVVVAAALHFAAAQSASPSPSAAAKTNVVSAVFGCTPAEYAACDANFKICSQ